MQKEFRLQSIELYNMFNYRGRHVINFTADRPGNIFLFNIQNGGGKTSLFLSIKWGFYGSESGIVYEKDGIRLSNKDFMNQDERSEGRFYVKISFVYDGKYMELRRECSDFNSDKTELTLKVDGVMERDAVAKVHVSQIIPPDYGDFFMFNGEVLQEIANNQRDTRKTEGVLKLLGLKQLNDLRDILASIQRSMTEDFKRTSGADSQFEKYVQDLNRMTDKHDRLTSKLESLRKEKERVQNEILTLEESRRRYNDIEGTLRSIDDLDAQKRVLERQKRDAVEYISGHSSNAFVLFLDEEIDALMEKLKERKRPLSQENRWKPPDSDKYLGLQQEMLEKHLEECPVCRQAVTPDVMHILEEAIKQASVKGKRYASNQREIGEINNTLDFLRKQKESIPTKLNEMCTELYEKSEEISTIDNKIQRLNELSSKSDVETVREVTDRLKVIYSENSKLDKEIFDTESKLKNTEENLRKIRNNMSKIEGLSEKQRIMSRRMTFLDRLINKLDLIIRNASMNKRSEILSKANDVFLDITNKRGIYRGLAYDDSKSFSMHIVRNDSQTVLHPSSGEKHVLAISFLISLSLNTERLNPMMMDTPLSRLDTVHKTNIGNALSKLGNQVIFLAQPGELDPETLECFKPSVAKMFVSKPDDENGACVEEVNL